MARKKKARSSKFATTTIAADKPALAKAAVGGRTPGTYDPFTTLEIRVPTNEDETSRISRNAESTIDAIQNDVASIETSSDFAKADAALTHIVREKDAAIKMRKEATGPLLEAKRRIESWFRPAIQALEAAEKSLKKSMGDYRLRQVEMEAKARAAAAKALDSGDSTKATAAIDVARRIAEPVKGARASTTFVWVIAKIDETKLPREYWTPNVAKIEDVAKRSPADASSDPPTIEGVTFERRARMGAKR